MRIIYSGLLLVLFSACSTMSPANLEGKRFDANSGFCKMQWRSAVDLYQGRSVLAPLRPRAHSHTPYLPRYIAQSQRDDNRRAYDQECESRSAYNSRLEKGKVFITTSKDT